jgi:hypothetical protein
MLEPPDNHSRAGPGFQLGHDLLDPTLGLVCGPLEEDLSILGSEDGSQQRDAAQVDAAVAQHRQEPGVRAAGPGHVDAQPGLGLREVEHLHTVGEHGGDGLPGVGSPGVDLSDVGDEVGLVTSDSAKDLGQAPQQLSVRHGLEIHHLGHGPEYGPGSGQMRSAWISPRGRSPYG